MSDTITQKYIRRYPESKRTKSWTGRMVHIQTENGVWKVGAHGYTSAGKPDAWVLPFEDAVVRVSHCGPEKRAAFIDVSSVSSIAGRSLADWRVFARRDDCLDSMVPSDLRALLAKVQETTG